MATAIKSIEDLGLIIHHIDKTQIGFSFKNETVWFFPYSGWHTGKTIKDGRGLQNLLKQLK